MNVLFLTLTAFDDINDRGIYYDLMRNIVSKGHNLYVVSPIERKFKRETFVHSNENCAILRVKTLNIQKTNIIEKGIGTLIIENQFKKAIIKFFKNVKFDLIIYSTPPITFTNVITFLKKRDNAKTYLLLKDIFPQNAVDLGFFSKKSLFYNFFRKKEQMLYAISDKIGCMSPANCSYLEKHNPNLDKNKIHINPNSIEITEIEIPDTKTIIQLKTKYNIPLNSTIFIYGGNLGKPQGIIYLIKLLELKKNISEIFFLIVGSGTEYSTVENWYNKNMPNNVKVLNYLPKKEFDLLISISDVGLIFLDPRFTIPNFPSRLLSYLEYSIPVLAATDKNTDIGLIAEQNGFGLWCENGDLPKMSAHIDVLVLNPTLRKTMGKKGNVFLQTNYSVQFSYQQIFNESIS